MVAVFDAIKIFKVKWEVIVRFIVLPWIYIISILTNCIHAYRYVVWCFIIIDITTSYVKVIYYHYLHDDVSTLSELENTQSTTDVACHREPNVILTHYATNTIVLMRRMFIVDNVTPRCSTTVVRRLTYIPYSRDHIWVWVKSI